MNSLEKAAREYVDRSGIEIKFVKFIGTFIGIGVCPNPTEYNQQKLDEKFKDTFMAGARAGIEAAAAITNEFGCANAVCIREKIRELAKEVKQ